jgi:PAS domain S-box-containing protein
MIFIIDREGRVLYVNSFAAQQFGRRPEEIIGKPREEFFPSGISDRQEHNLRKAFATGQPVYVENRTPFPDHELWLGTWLVPLKDEAGEVRAVLGVSRDITQRKRAEEEAQRRSRELEALATLTQIASRSLDLEELLQGSLPKIAGALEIELAMVFLGEEEEERLRLCGFHGSAPGLPAEEPWLAVGECLCGLTAAEGRPIFSEDLPNDPRYTLEAGKCAGLRSLAAIPLRASEKQIGVLTVGSAHRRDFTRDERFLSAIADSLATAVQNARLFEQVHTGRERLQTLSRQLIGVQEAECRRLARELHDEIGQALTAVKINLEVAQNLADTPALGPRLEESVGLIESTLQQVRDLSRDLRPSLLDDLGLVAALRWYVNRQAQRAGFIPQFVADPLETRLSPDLETACFRVAQEALTNVARHAQAQHVSVELRPGPPELQLIIRDDGVGFDVRAALERAAHGASLGLLGMQERVLLVGGQIDIESTPAQGTEIRARFPMSGTE